jgi:hypothetical protein
MPKIQDSAKSSAKWRGGTSSFLSQERCCLARHLALTLLPAIAKLPSCCQQ